jgi:hypothetical protein
MSKLLELALFISVVKQSLDTSVLDGSLGRFVTTKGSYMEDDISSNVLTGLFASCSLKCWEYWSPINCSPVNIVYSLVKNFEVMAQELGKII